MKNRRHAKILELINVYSVDTQEELQNLLKKEGYCVTQATVSRDIKELRLLKTLSPDGKYRYTSASGNAVDVKTNFNSLFKSSVTFVDCAENMIVIKTLTGMAQAVCTSLDSMEFENTLGTIAGDDTIFIVSKNNSTARALVAEFKKLL
ncbi:MAG: arginine repressor [Oscillospiraceae bacterium]|nr:arginine repressor [Oscillospiraceae bacterium]